MTAAEAAGAVDPTVWRVLALLMTTGAVLAVLLGWHEQRALERRTRRLAGTTSRRSPERPWAVLGTVGRQLRDRPAREFGLALGAAALGPALIGGPVGWSVAPAAGWAAWWWQRRRGTHRTAGDSVARAAVGQVERQLPLAAELLAACLTAGSAPAQAAEAVGAATKGPLGDRLVRAAAELRLGAEPGAVWDRFGALPGCEGLARCMERAGTAGVPPVQAVARLAAECRTRRARAASARARRAAVLVTGPLGLCFLPAFLAVGVAPVVLGLARSLL